jgi:hypothetical protein
VPIEKPRRAWGRPADGLSADAHRLGHIVEPDLHLVEHAFMLPAFDPPQLVRRALGFQCAGEASRQMSVNINVVLAI